MAVKTFGVLGGATFVNTNTEQKGIFAAGFFSDVAVGGGGGPVVGTSSRRLFPVEDTARLYPRKNLNRLFPVT